MEEHKIVKEWTTEAGLRAVIILGHLDLRSELMEDDWHCGYVEVPKDSKLSGVDYGDEKLYGIEVHGGLTYSRKGDGYPIEEESNYWFGFDCHHYMDTIAVCDEEYVTNECEELAKQLVKLSQEE